MIRTAIFTRFS